MHVEEQKKSITWRYTSGQTGFRRGRRLLATICRSLRHRAWPQPAGGRAVTRAMCGHQMTLSMAPMGSSSAPLDPSVHVLRLLGHMVSGLVWTHQGGNRCHLGGYPGRPPRGLLSKPGRSAGDWLGPHRRRKRSGIMGIYEFPNSGDLDFVNFEFVILRFR